MLSSREIVGECACRIHESDFLEITCASAENMEVDGVRLVSDGQFV